ncbi:hypothetical protein LN042_30925 [Kitasatospora sp. RB6PN24]|uniref:hypothetical protein n=1 Tax=Kitasatospora humi TaxID=2893891 RepID=UPI001E475EC0|nr:hypothetical protein [Kitasatospora humi]MCC9311425.1 hypothetical protein [Kitasatospora humi]
MEGDAGDTGPVAEQVEAVGDVLGVQEAAVAVEDVAAAVGDGADGAGVGAGVEG